MRERNMRKRLTAAALCGMLALTGCTASKEPPKEEAMEPVQAEEPDNGQEGLLAEGPDNEREGLLADEADMEAADIAAKDFALRLFCGSLEEGKDTLLSPFSVLCALSMTANGAKGETKEQMERALGLPVEELNTYLSSRVKGLPNGAKYKFHSANSLWLREAQALKLDEGFAKASEEFYGADVFESSFDGQTVKDINQWVEENTDGMIGRILDEIPEDALMYLINAIAFDAEWEDIYTDAQVSKGTFTREDGSTREVELMHSDEYRYLEDGHASGFLKYYADRSYAFAAILPEEGLSVKDYASQLTGEKLGQMLESASQEKVEAAIPKFEAEFGTELNSTLKEMGIEDAFDSGKADFTGIVSGGGADLYMGHVLHKAHMTVDEKGTKAGAATSVSMAGTALEEPKEVILDRPFLYLLMDCESQTILFLGAMME